MRKSGLVVVAVVALVSLWALGNAGSDPSVTAKDSLVVYPSFCTEMTSPMFCVEYTNTGDKNADLLSLLMSEAIILDGKEYPRAIAKFAGGSSLFPGRSWKHTIEIGPSFLGKKRLSVGRHTLIVKFAGAESRELPFEWTPRDDKNVEPEN